MEVVEPILTALSWEWGYCCLY